MLLHTDAHNKNVRYKMTKEQYVRQAKTIDGVNTIPADILEVLFDNITFLKFVYAEDDMDVDGQRIAEVQPPAAASWFPRRRNASNQRSDSYSMIRYVSDMPSCHSYDSGDRRQETRVEDGPSPS